MQGVNRLAQEKAHVGGKREPAKGSRLIASVAEFREELTIAPLTPIGGEYEGSLTVRTTTALPPKTPAIHRVATICQILVEKPKRIVDRAAPTREMSRTGRLP
jgi:hypothetical protein